jgi:hypothetical protein
MTETVGTDRLSVAEPVSRPRSRRPSNVNASALGRHLDCSRTYIGKLEAEGVIQRQGDSFPLDPCRVAHLRYLRRERQQSPRTEADADHVKVKTEMLQLRLMEKKRELVRRSDEKSGGRPRRRPGLIKRPRVMQRRVPSQPTMPWQDDRR